MMYGVNTCSAESENFLAAPGRHMFKIAAPSIMLTCTLGWMNFLVKKLGLPNNLEDPTLYQFSAYPICDNDGGHA